MKDLKRGIVKIKVTDQEDYYYLDQVIEQDDFIHGMTERKIKIGDEPNVKTINKKINAEIQVEKTEYEPGSRFKANGRLTQAPEDVGLGNYQSFNLKEGDIISIKKEWNSYYLKKLEEASLDKVKVLLVIFDREEAKLADLNKENYEIISELKGNVEKKMYETNTDNKFYKEILEKIIEYEKRKNYDKIIIASPAFWNEYLFNIIPDDLKKKCVKATVSTTDKSGFDEVVKRQELDKALKDHKLSNETSLIEKILGKIKQDLACYGWEDTLEKLSIGSVEEIALSEEKMAEFKNKGEYGRVSELLKLAEKMNTKINIISSKDANKKLNSIGGVAGILRWQQ